MAQSRESEGLSAVDLANYPLVLRERFLALSGKRQTASSGAVRHFIDPEIDEILDDYLAWAQIFGV